jgi:PilZ domain
MQTRYRLAEAPRLRAIMSERRRSNRQKSFLRGCIYYNNRRSATDCLVRDISPRGARLIFSDTVSIPDVIELYLAQKQQTIRAEVQWRRGDEVGVAFGTPRTSEYSADRELLGRVEKLESEIASLRKMLKQLKADVGAGNEQAA